jgi:S1-C subfamily serine protease
VHKATRIYITDNNGHQYLAKEIAADDLNDISLLKLESEQPLNLTPITFARADEPVMLGETVIAVGNPYGLGSSISKGIVSAIGRKVTYKGKVLFDDILQTDAPINPGNSGGPLVNINGELIGLNTAIFEQANSIGFAIALKLIEKGLAMWLIPERFSDVSLGLIPGETVKDGRTVFLCREIITGSPAERKGLEKNDEIMLINGREINHLMDISNVLWQLKGGDSITLTLKDKGKVMLTVEKLEALDGEKLITQKLGIEAVKLTKQLAGQLNYPFYDGLIVNEVSPRNPALSRGDVIVKIGDVPVYDYADVRRALNGKYYGDKVKALVIFGAKKFGKTQLYKKNVFLNVL